MMGMQVKLAYGRGNLLVNLPETTQLVETKFNPGLADELGTLCETLRSPIGSAPLAEKVKPGNRVVIVHSDITRATPNDRILPVILTELEAAGITRQDITLMNAL